MRKITTNIDKINTIAKETLGHIDTARKKFDVLAGEVKEWDEISKQYEILREVISKYETYKG